MGPGFSGVWVGRGFSGVTGCEYRAVESSESRQGTASEKEALTGVKGEQNPNSGGAQKQLQPKAGHFILTNPAPHHQGPLLQEPRHSHDRLAQLHWPLLPPCQFLCPFFCIGSCSFSARPAKASTSVCPQTIPLSHCPRILIQKLHLPLNCKATYAYNCHKRSP